jgi:hypothetical protein
VEMFASNALQKELDFKSKIRNNTERFYPPLMVQYLWLSRRIHLE